MPDQLSPQLVMQRDSLDSLPPVVLPDGYSLRTYQEGDGPYWAVILNEAFAVQWTAEDFQRIMVDDPAFRPNRLFFVIAPDGTPCATAGAYRRAEQPEEGYLHYVACQPGHAGKRLGAMVSLACLYQFRAEGCTSVTLQTDDFRLPAIKTYLRLDFHPLIIHENQHARWATILHELAISVS